MVNVARGIIQINKEVVKYTWPDGGHSIEAHISINCPCHLGPEVVEGIVGAASRNTPNFKPHCNSTDQAFTYDPSEPSTVLIGHALDHITGIRAAERVETIMPTSNDVPVIIDSGIRMHIGLLEPPAPAIIETKVMARNPEDRIDFEVNLEECLMGAITEIEDLIFRNW